MPSIEVVTDPTGSDSVFDVSTVAVAAGDFLISLCALRTDVLTSLVVDRLLASVRAAFSWPRTINCSANPGVGTGSHGVVKAVRKKDSRTTGMRNLDSK